MNRKSTSRPFAFIAVPFFSVVVLIVILLQWVDTAVSQPPPVQDTCPSDCPESIRQPDDDPTVLFDFEAGLEGWGNLYGAIINLAQSSEQVYSGTYSLRLDMDLYTSTNTVGEAYVEFPTARTDLGGQTLTARIFAPTGARGQSSEKPNGLHMFIEDDNGKRVYGSWRNILEEGWYEVTLKVSATLPACGSADSGFNPNAIKKIGINIGMSTGADQNSNYQGPIYMDTIKIGTLQTLPSDHLYDFEDSTAQFADSKMEYASPSWGANGWSALSIQNGALIANSTFMTDTDANRKGFMGIIYSAYLNLAHKDHHTINVDIRFDPSAEPPAHCPFVVSLWVWDDVKQKWFWSDIQHVGSGEWTTISFNLDNPAELAPGVQDYEGDMPTLSDIRQVGIQLYANVPYTGTVMFDNIVVGGEEIPGQYPSQNEDFVTAVGDQFMLDGESFRFLNFNIEYLFTLREVEIAMLLDEIAQMPGNKVIRTWGFSEGCESEDANCAAYSRYFQPERGIWNETALENFDRFLAMAGKRGIRVIIALANNWEEYGGIHQYMTWLEDEHPTNIPIGVDPESDEYHDLFFTDEVVRGWYKAHVDKLIGRVNSITSIPYADDPTIFSWEVINEARAKSDVSGEKTHHWLQEMSNYIWNELDDNHMIGTGAEGWYIMPGPEAETYAVKFGPFPKNIWLLGVDWSETCDPDNTFGANGIGFFEIHSTTPITSYSQEYYGEDCVPFPEIHTSLQGNMPNIHYTSLHLYVAQSEANIYRAPYCDWGFVGHLCDEHDFEFFQAGEWIGKHVSDSHDVINKPIIVAEFGLRKSETYKGMAGEYRQFVPAFTTAEREALYQHYVQTMCQMGVNGALVWNLGHERFNDILWDGVESFDADYDEVDDWQIDIISSDATTMTLNNQPTAVTWGSKSIQVHYDAAKGFGQASLGRININEDWRETEDGNRDHVRLEFDVYNAATEPISVSVELTSGSIVTVYESIPFPVPPQTWTTVLVNAQFPYWNCESGSCENTDTVQGLDDVAQFQLIFANYTESGEVYIDYVRHQGGDSLVILPDEPLFDVIRDEVEQWAMGCNLPDSHLFLPFVIQG